jgi:hypothetical protein
VQPGSWLITIAHLLLRRLPALLALQETVAERKAARKAERDALARGEMPDSLKEWRVSFMPVHTPVSAVMLWWQRQLHPGSRLRWLGTLRGAEVAGDPQGG